MPADLEARRPLLEAVIDKVMQTRKDKQLRAEREKKAKADELRRAKLDELEDYEESRPGATRKPVDPDAPPAMILRRTPGGRMVERFAKGGSIRGAGCEKRGTRPAKYY